MPIASSGRNYPLFIVYIADLGFCRERPWDRFCSALSLFRVLWICISACRKARLWDRSFSARVFARLGRWLWMGCLLSDPGLIEWVREVEPQPSRVLIIDVNTCVLSLIDRLVSELIKVVLYEIQFKYLVRKRIIKLIIRSATCCRQAIS